MENFTLQDFLELMSKIPVTNEIPVDPPSTNTTLRLYENGATIRVYFYFNGAWRYATLT